MSEQEAEQAGGNSGSLSVEPGVSASSEAAREPGAAAVESSDANAASAVATSEASVTSAAAETKAEASAAAVPKIEIDAEAMRSDASKPEAAYAPGKVIVMSPRDRGFDGDDTASKPKAADGEVIFGKRRIAALAAVVALATIAGALGGAMATASFMHGGGQAAAANEGQGALEASLSRLDADVQALKAGLDHTSRLGMSQFSKTSDRLDKLERAQAEPAAKLARLSEAVDKLRVAPPVVAAAATPAASRETTGSVPAAAAAQSATPASPSRPEVGRLPTLDDWVLRDVAQGGALIDGRRGIYEVYAGDVVPGLGRIDAIRRQDGRWVVVTSRGLIVAR